MGSHGQIYQQKHKHWIADHKREQDKQHLNQQHNVHFFTLKEGKLENNCLVSHP